MKFRLRSPELGESGLLDLFIIIVTVAMIAAFGFFFLSRPRVTRPQINCVNNLKQVGLAYRLWAGDNGDKYPAQISTNAGGTMELVALGRPFSDFMIMSNEIFFSKTLVCPEDKRLPAANFGALANVNVSYFNVPEADETNPALWLTGDRNVATNNAALSPGMFTMPTNRVFSWTAQIHNNKGNIGLADGSVQQFDSKRLHQSATNALQSRFAITNDTFRLLIP